MEQINSLDDSTVSLSSPTSSIGKKRKPGPKASVFISFFCEGKCSECGHVPKDKLTASNAKRHLHNSHPHLPIFNEDPSKLLALYAATSSMSLCHIENPYLKVLGAFVYDPGIQVPTRRALAGMINRQCEGTMNDIRERVRKVSTEPNYLRSIRTKLRARLEIRFDHVLSSGMPGSDPIYVAASFFDPSVSCLDVLLGWEKKAKNAIKFIVEKFADDEDSQVEHVWVDEAVSEPIRKNLFSFYGTNLRPTIHLQSEISNLSEEIDAFLANLWNSGIPEEATLFWERNKSVRFYKQISPVALSFLASPVHSGAVERMFLQLTLNTSGHKGSTNPALASRKVLMNFNKKFVS
uniref:HAT C-terminal dimerisation domain-containing protein n=1 Tax=Ditylenchus dipsaci TaxID=166011 RepID=A0A915DIR2_9BILA